MSPPSTGSASAVALQHLYEQRQGDPTPRRKIFALTSALGPPSRSRARAGAVLAVVEDLLGEHGDAARVAVDLLEDLQNVASHRIEGLITPEALLPLFLW